jgi:hypothetical protein
VKRRLFLFQPQSQTQQSSQLGDFFTAPQATEEELEAAQAGALETPGNGVVLQLRIRIDSLHSQGGANKRLISYIYYIFLLLHVTNSDFSKPLDRGFYFAIRYASGNTSSQTAWTSSVC